MSRQTTAITPSEFIPRGRMGLASIKDAEQFLNLSRATLYGLMDRGALRYVKIGKSRRIAWAALDELVERNTMGP